MPGSARPTRRALAVVEAEPVQATDLAAGAHATTPGLSLASCRRHLGTACAHMSDAEVTRLRDQIYEVAHSIFAIHPDSAARVEWSALHRLSSEDREAVEERAAVLEFDAGMTRTQATRTAMASHLKTARLTKVGSER